MKVFIKVSIVVLCLGWAGYVFAHCGTCGVSDGFVCPKDQSASADAGKCPNCGGDLQRGEIQEVKKYVCPNCGSAKDVAGICDGPCKSDLLETTSYIPKQA